MKNWLHKLKKKHIFITISIIIGLTIIVLATKSILYNVKISPLVKEEQSYKFPDINTEIKKHTGLINKDIEKKLNEAGIFDYEIERLDKEDIKTLSKCTDITKIDADKEIYVRNNIRKVEDYEYGYAEINEISNRHIISKGVDLHSISNIIFQSDSNKEKNIINTITICTWYKMPKKLGNNVISYSQDNAYSNIVKHKSYGVYNIDTYKDINAVSLRKKEKNINVNTPPLSTRIFEELDSQFIVFKTDKLFKYLDLEKTLHWKSLYKELRRKEIEFVKVNNVSFIVSMEHEMDTLENMFTYLINYYHQEKNPTKELKIPATSEELNFNDYLLKFGQGYSQYDAIIDEEDMDEDDDEEYDDEVVEESPLLEYLD